MKRRTTVAKVADKPAAPSGFPALAKALGITEAEARQRWHNTDLDGDERKSLDDKFKLGYTGGGGVGKGELVRGLEKLKR